MKEKKITIGMKRFIKKKKENLHKFLFLQENKNPKKKKKSVSRKRIKTTMQRKLETLMIVMMVEHCGGG